MGSSWNFWKTIKEVSPKAIEKEAATPFRLALVGDDEQIRRLRDALLTSDATAAEREAAPEYLAEMREPPSPIVDDEYPFILYASGGAGSIGARGVNSSPIVGTPEEVAAGMIAQRPDLAVALARRFPLLRVPACTRIINDTCRVNANFALISALPGVFPVAAVFLPATSMADIVILTKNQIMMLMRMAAAHGKKPGYTRQIKELIATVGGALGWRTVARQVVALVPAGVGAALKATIAYSGTFALGRTGLAFYQHGRVLSAAEIRKAYQSKMADARREIEGLRKPN